MTCPLLTPTICHLRLLCLTWHYGLALLHSRSPCRRDIGVCSGHGGNTRIRSRATRSIASVRARKRRRYACVGAGSER
jgi:hypothetical protein